MTLTGALTNALLERMPAEGEVRIIDLGVEQYQRNSAYFAMTVLEKAGFVTRRKDEKRRAVYFRRTDRPLYERPPSPMQFKSVPWLGTVLNGPPPLPKGRVYSTAEAA